MGKNKEKKTNKHAHPLKQNPSVHTHTYSHDNFHSCFVKIRWHQLAIDFICTSIRGIFTDKGAKDPVEEDEKVKALVLKNVQFRDPMKKKPHDYVQCKQHGA